MTSQPRPTAMVSDPDGLMRHSFLNALNIVVNEEFRFLICRACHEAINASSASSIRQHLTSKHAEGSFRLGNSDNLDTIMETLKVVTTLPVIRGPRPVVNGLPVIKAFACNTCSSVYTTLETMRKHYSEHHKGVLKKTWRACMAQRLCKGGVGIHRVLWEVELPLHEAGTADPQKELVQQLMQQIEEDLTVTTEALDPRMVSPWLHSTRWHVCLVPRTTRQDIDALRSLVALPTAGEGWLKGLKEALRVYFEAALTLIDKTDVLVLKRLNSPDLLKE